MIRKIAAAPTAQLASAAGKRPARKAPTRANLKTAAKKESVKRLAVKRRLGCRFDVAQVVKTSQLSDRGPKFISRESNSAFLDLNSPSERIPF